MGYRIIDFCECDQIGRPLPHRRGGALASATIDNKVSTYINLSGNDADRRLVFRLAISGQHGTKYECVLKIAPVYEQKIKEKLGDEKIIMDAPYIHETNIYAFFKKEGETQGGTQAKHVLDSYGGGYSPLVFDDYELTSEWHNQSDITFDGKPLTLGDRLERSIRNQLQVWEERRRRQYEKTPIGLSWLITEYNENYVTLLGEEARLEECQKKYVMESLFETVSYLWDKYRFCHWDLNPGNVMFDKTTNKVVMFDFDMSTVGTVDQLQFSNYIFLVPFLQSIICKMPTHDLGANLNIVGHFYDILNIYNHFGKAVEDGSRIYKPISNAPEWPNHLNSTNYKLYKDEMRQLTVDLFDSHEIEYGDIGGHFLLFGWIMLQMVLSVQNVWMG